MKTVMMVNAVERNREGVEAPHRIIKLFNQITKEQ